MSTLTQFAGGGVKSVQTGFVQTTSAATAGAGEDVRYLDITISPITNIAKCVLFFDGAVSSPALGYASYNSSSAIMVIATKRVLNSTTIRLSSASTASYFVGRWTLVEYN